ncbi:MAG: hypothetical protein OXC57_12390 [Rhodobacteraceae bacterium]|nr:hypothetical protein [Paracoccaceae bacterium]
MLSDGEIAYFRHPTYNSENLGYGSLHLKAMFSPLVVQQMIGLGINFRPAFNKAFDAWISAGHLRFGPTEYFDRGLALSFWPDTRGRINRTLNSLISELDPVIEDLEEFMTVSVAGRGFFYSRNAVV